MTASSSLSLTALPAVQCTPEVLRVRLMGPFNSFSLCMDQLRSNYARAHGLCCTVESLKHVVHVTESVSRLSSCSVG